MTAMPPGPESNPDVAATVRLLHRRHGWGRAAVTTFIAFLLAEGGNASAQSQGTPPPSWYEIIVLVLGALTIVGIVAAVADTVVLRRRPAAVLAQAAPLAAHDPSRRHAHHYPPRHWLTWTLRWTGMLLILVVAVLSVPAVFDGAAYLAGAGKTVVFVPAYHDTTCTQYDCQTSTIGILETGGAGVQATWPDVVPLGRSFRVRQPMWRWGLGEALINNDGIAVAAILISLLMEGTAVLVVIRIIKLAGNWRRHRRQRSAPAVSSVSLG